LTPDLKFKFSLGGHKTTEQTKVLSESDVYFASTGAESLSNLPPCSTQWYSAFKIPDSDSGKSGMGMGVNPRIGGHRPRFVRGQVWTGTGRPSRFGRNRGRSPVPDSHRGVRALPPIPGKSGVGVGVGPRFPANRGRGPQTPIPGKSGMGTGIGIGGSVPCTELVPSSLLWLAKPLFRKSRTTNSESQTRKSPACSPVGPDSRFPAESGNGPFPDSRFPIPDSRFPIPDSRFPANRSESGVGNFLESIFIDQATLNGTRPNSP
jgi:hypothetical protein